MKILALEIPGRNPGGEFPTSLLAQEAREVWRLTQDGALREIYFRADREEAVLILEAESPAAARKILDGLPLVTAGLIDFDVIPLKAYPGFQRLFPQNT